MTIKIVTDSSITIEPELVEELDITVVPLSVTIDGTTYLDSDLPLDSFMEKMKASKALPKTSQPPVGVFAEKYEEISCIFRTSVLFYHGVKRAVLCRRCPEKCGHHTNSGMNTYIFRRKNPWISSKL